jgi:hypothetical protein
MNTELVERLERILPGLQNSSSAAEDAMIRALPEIIAALARADDMLDALKQIARLETDPSMNDITRIAMMAQIARLRVHISLKGT